MMWLCNMGERNWKQKTTRGKIRQTIIAGMTEGKLLFKMLQGGSR